MRSRTPYLRTSIALLVGLLLMLGVAACGGGPTESSASPGEASGNFTLSLTTDPNPPEAGPVTITVEVKDAQGSPVEGASVSLTSGMVGMSHGGMRGQLEDAGGGQYQGSGSFGMRGSWRLDISVSKEGATSEQTFEVQVR
jgi:hypothetical protein